MFDKSIYSELLNMPEQQPEDFSYPALREKVLALAGEFDNLLRDASGKDGQLKLCKEQVDYLTRRLATFEAGRDPVQEFAQEFSSTMQLLQGLDDHIEKSDSYRKSICMELILYLEDNGHQKAARALRKKENM